MGRREGGTLSPVLRQAWDGERLAVRSRGGTASVDDPHMSVIGHVTSEELRAKLTDTDMANGFGNRHLFVLVTRSKLLPDGGALPEEAMIDLGRRTRHALEGARKRGRLHRTNEAAERWGALYYEMAEDDPGGLLGSLIAHDAAQVLRLSVAYALASGAQSIDVPHVEAAWALWQYCRESAAQIFGDLSGNPLADKLLKAIQAAGPEGLDARRRDRATSGNADKAKLNAALDYLVRCGKVVRHVESTGGRPRDVAVHVSFVTEETDLRKNGSSR